LEVDGVGVDAFFDKLEHDVLSSADVSDLDAEPDSKGDGESPEEVLGVTVFLIELVALHDIGRLRGRFFFGHRNS